MFDQMGAFVVEMIRSRRMEGEGEGKRTLPHQALSTSTRSSRRVCQALPKPPVEHVLLRIRLLPVHSTNKSAYQQGGYEPFILTLLIECEKVQIEMTENAAHLYTRRLQPNTPI